MNADLLLLGAFLHDIGKVDELVYDREMGYSDRGQLIGHLILAVELLNEKVKQCQSLADEPFPETVHMLLKHMILSHHGEYAFGSPKLPMTMEAIALHFLDNLDAKLEMFKFFMEGDPNTDNNWTAYLPTIDRKLYKVGVPAPDAE
jgi:3'-5' exoribonuclease